MNNKVKIKQFFETFAWLVAFASKIGKKCMKLDLYDIKGASKVSLSEPFEAHSL